MKRIDYLSNNSTEFKAEYGHFEVEELVENKYWKVPLLRGFTEISKLLELCKKHEAYICGGYARYCASKNYKGIEGSKDIDIFSKDEAGYRALHDELYKILFPFINSGVVSIFETKYAISFSLNEYTDGPHSPLNEQIFEVKQILSDVFPIQIIKPHLITGMTTNGSVFEILKAFDISVCQAAIISPTEVLVSKDFKNQEPKGIMTLSNIHNPFMTLNRIMKYTNKKYIMRAVDIAPLLSYYNEHDKNSNRITSDQIEFIERKGQS